jgi:hypothetical protein
METSPCLVMDDKDCWINNYPKEVKESLNKLEKLTSLSPFDKHHISKCSDCDVEFLVAVNDPYLETDDGSVAVMFAGEYHYISDEKLKK